MYLIGKRENYKKNIKKKNHDLKQRADNESQVKKKTTFYFHVTFIDFSINQHTIQYTVGILSLQ